MNQIDAVCQTIEKTINQAVQKTLDQLEKDCDTICSTISGKLEADRSALLNEFSMMRHKSHCCFCCRWHARRRILPPPRILSPDVVRFARRDAVTHNKSLHFHSFLCGALGFLLPALLILSLVANTFTKEQLGELLGEGPAQFVSIVTVSIGKWWCKWSGG